MHPDDALGIAAVGARLLAVAGAEGGVPQRQRRTVEDLVGWYAAIGTSDVPTRYVLALDAVDVLGGLPRKPVPSIARGLTIAGAITWVNPAPRACSIARLISASSSSAPTPVRK